ncbi:MAG: exonuclease domain-containing protein [bacterium]|nr:exonuclease domain-containing protein [bacterium]
MSDKLAFIDIETTGSSMLHDRIIEIGIIRVEDDQVSEVFETLINPQTYVSPFITELTGITSQEVEQAPPFEEIEAKVHNLLKDCTFVAHNVRFDYGFVKNEFKRLGRNFSSELMCTVRLSRKLFPHHTRHNLDAIIKRHDIQCENRHRALGDAKVIWEFYQKIRRKFNSKTLDKAFDWVMRKPSLPFLLNPEVLENIPESCGVYIFYGENDLPLYVGKSVNMKERVLTRLTNDHHSAKESSISAQLRRIEWIQTIGELGAHILESSKIKDLQPVYNRKIRFDTACEKTRVQAWPYKGVISVLENDIDGNGECHFIDKWCYMGSSKSEGDGEHSTFSSSQVFDYDIYKIVASYLKKKGNKRSIKVIGREDFSTSSVFEEYSQEVRY